MNRLAYHFIPFVSIVAFLSVVILASLLICSWTDTLCSWPRPHRHHRKPAPCQSAYRTPQIPMPVILRTSNRRLNDITDTLTQTRQITGKVAPGDSAASFSTRLSPCADWQGSGRWKARAARIPQANAISPQSVTKIRLEERHRIAPGRADAIASGDQAARTDQGRIVIEISLATHRPCAIQCLL